MVPDQSPAETMTFHGQFSEARSFLTYSSPSLLYPETRLPYGDSTVSAFSSLHDEDHTLMESSATESAFSMAEEDFAAALANYQPCDDCSPATLTAIPHHHHPSGRLPGASATLAGHFCCSWLIDGQPCFLCFESAQALDNHIKNDHAGKDGTYRCLWHDCSKHDPSTKIPGTINFGNKPKLMRHVHSHTGYKPFPCPYPGCDKGFVTKEQLNNHETTHTKSRKYKCDQCGKAFAVKSALTTHITAVHEEKKTHRCDMCGKAFADSSNLSKHKQTHFKDNGVKKQRGRRSISITTGSTRSSPSISTPSTEHAVPLSVISQDCLAFNIMAPPAIPKSSIRESFPTIPVSQSFISTLSSASSPPPENFDPDCYCCEQRCTPPDGPATPCNEAEDCGRDGFCDLPDCHVQDDYNTEQMRDYRPWDEMMNYESQQSLLDGEG